MALKPMLLMIVWLGLVRSTYQQNCPQDIVYIVDRAAYIQSSSPQNNLNQNWNLIKTFLDNLLLRMRYDPQNAQLATVTYGDTATTVFTLGTYTNVNGASSAILALDYMGGGRSNITDALLMTRLSVLTAANGKRPNTPSICFLDVSYPPLDSTSATAEIANLKTVCRVMVIGTAEAGRLQSLNNTYQSYATNYNDYFEAPFLSLNATSTVDPIISSLTRDCPLTTPTIAQPTGNHVTNKKSDAPAITQGTSVTYLTTFLLFITAKALLR